MHYSKITDATLNNLIRKSSYIDEVSHFRQDTNI